MTWFDHSRRAVAILLVALVLVAVPAVASATFSGNRTSGVAVGTDRLELPAAVTGTYKCTTAVPSESFDVTVAGFSDSGPVGATYRYSLLRGTTVVKSTTSTSRVASLSSGNVAVDLAATQWSVTIQATLGPWTGPVFNKAVTCPVLRTVTGAL
jgi:phage baseplate assembly protein gpV